MPDVSSIIGACRDGNERRHVRLTHQSIEGRDMDIDDFLQVIELDIDAGHKVVEQFVCLPCWRSISTANDACKRRQLGIEPGREAQGILPAFRLHLYKFALNGGELLL